MKIKYIHFSEPQKEKIYDTEKSYKNRLIIGMNNEIDMEKFKQTQEDFDKQELEKMSRDKEKGHIIQFSIIEE